MCGVVGTPSAVAGALNSMVNLVPQSPLARLLLGYAPAAARGHHARAWVLDERLAAILQGGREPALMAIRLAWWRDALAHEDQSKGKGEPLIEAFRVAGLTAFEREMIGACIEGWSRIAGADDLSEADLRAYAQGRGGGLFGLIAGDDAPGLMAAGAAWALWDLAGHVSDPELAQMCLLTAAGFVAHVDTRLIKAHRPLRLALLVAAGDIRARRAPRNGFAFHHYARIVLAGLLR